MSNADDDDDDDDGDVIAAAVVCCHFRNPFTRQSEPISNGSGFIVRDDGIILTNAHVVGNNTTVRVKLNDGRSFDGFVQAVDPVSDLATVKINAVIVFNISTMMFVAAKDANLYSVVFVHQ